MLNTQTTTTEAPTSIDEWAQRVRQLHDGDKWETSALPTLPLEAPAWCVEIEEDRVDYPTIMFSLLGRQWAEEGSVRVEQYVSVNVDSASPGHSRMHVLPAELFVIADGHEFSATNAFKLAAALQGAASELERWAA